MKSDQLGRVLSDDDLPSKLSLANEFKAFVKKNSVPSNLIHPYFLTLSRAIKAREDPQLTSVCFSCFCHLFKRVSIQDKQLLDDSATVAVVTDLLIDRLSDRSTGVRATANKVLLDYWVLVPQAVAVAMRQGAVVSASHVTLGESLKWLQSVFDLSSAFNFSAFVQPVVDMLRYPQLQASVCDLLKTVYSVSDRRELEECLAATGVNEMLKKEIMSGLPERDNEAVAAPVSKPVPVRALSGTQRNVPSNVSTKEYSSSHAPSSLGKENASSNTSSLGKENTPASSLAFLDSLPNYRVDSLAPENVYSGSDLEMKFQSMHTAFADKESEKNWSAREKHVTQIRKLLRGNALRDYPSQFAAAYKSVIDGVLKSATSLRTTLSNQGLLLVKESGQIGGCAFVDPVLDLVLPQIIRLTGQMKKITSNNAHITVCGLITSATFSTKLISHVTSATAEKNAQPRTFAAVWLRIIILSHSQAHRSALQNHGGLDQIERAIAKGLQDPNPSVKENTRVTYWSLAEFWPQEADRVYQKLDTKARGMLDKVNPSGAKNAPMKKPAPRESLKDVMRRSRESSASRDPLGSASASAAPPQRAKMGAPQRTSSGLVGRSLSGSHVTDRSTRLSATSRDQQRAVSDSSSGRPGMTRSVSGRLSSREPSLARGSARDPSQMRRQSRGETVSRDPSLTRGSRELPKQRGGDANGNRPRVGSITRDSRFGQPRQSRDMSHPRDQSRDSSRNPSRDSSLAPSIKSSTVPSRESSPPKEELPTYDVDMDDDDPFVTQQLKLSRESLKLEVEGAEVEAAGVVGAAEATEEAAEAAESAPVDIPATTAPVDIPSSRDSTPPDSSPFVLAKSPATQGVSTSPATGKSVSPPATAEDELSRDLRGEEDIQEVNREAPREDSGMEVDKPEDSDVVMGGEGGDGGEGGEGEVSEVEYRDVESCDPVTESRDAETRDAQSRDAESRDVETHAPSLQGNEQAEPESHDAVADSPTHGADSADRQTESNVPESKVPETSVPILSPRPIHPAKFELDEDAMVVDVVETSDEPITVDEAETVDSEAREESGGSEEDVGDSSRAQGVGFEGQEVGSEGQQVHEAHEVLSEAPETVKNVDDSVQDFSKPLDIPNGDIADGNIANGDLPNNQETESALSQETGSRSALSDQNVTEAIQEDPFAQNTSPDESEPMEMCDSDDALCQENNDQSESASLANLKNQLNTSPPETLTTLLSNPSQYKEILTLVPAELFLLCVILFSEPNLADAQQAISTDTNLALSTASSMIMVCARDVYPSDSRWSRASVEELKHVTVTCLDWLTQLVTESSEASKLLATNKRYRTSLVHLLSTSVELHRQKFGHVTHNALIHVIEAMDRLSQQQRPVDKRTSRAFLEAPSPSPDASASTVEDVTDKLRHVTVGEHLKTVRVLPPQLASGHVVAPGSDVTWSKLELERLARSPSCSDTNESILDSVSRDKVSVTQLSTLASRVPHLDDVDELTATVLAYLHISHPPALTTAALVVIKQVLTKPGPRLSMAHVTEIFATLGHVNGHIDSRSPLAAAIEELVADLLTHTESSEMLEFLLLSRSRDSKTQNKLLLLNTVYHVLSPELLPSHETQLLALISELISDPDPLVRRVTVGLVVRVLRLSPDMEGSVSLAIKSKMDLVRYYMGA